MEIYVPGGGDAAAAISKTTHLAVSAHEDDIEFMAYDGILACRGGRGSFTAVILGDGGGSPRAGAYADYTDEEMKRVRREEQMRAAEIGGYGAVVFFDLPSSRIKDPGDTEAVEGLGRIISEARPEIIYTHNVADKHDTHVAAALRVIEALRRVRYVPRRLYGCEVWRSLDWVNDDDKVRFSVGGEPELEAALLGVFDSQIAGGKKYDSAVIGRRRANATFGESHGVDTDEEVCFAIDMTPLAENVDMSAPDFIDGYIGAFRRDVLGRIERLK